MPDSVAHPPVTLSIFAITVSDPSLMLSSIGVMVTVAVVDPEGIVIVVLFAV